MATEAFACILMVVAGVAGVLLAHRPRLGS